jgi:hypothetical protein
VMTNEFGMFKLVNREVFSHANFNSREVSDSIVNKTWGRSINYPG